MGFCYHIDNMKYRLKKGFLVQKLNNELMIFDEEKSLLYTLNETASFVFSLIKKGFDEEEIVEKMIKKYQIKKIRAQKDVKELINDFLKKKIIEKNKS